MTDNIYNMDKHTILTLLPYAIESQLINKQQKLGDLHLTKNLIAFSINALETFLKGNLAEFDAQIGENLCQIRAYKILHLARKWLYSDILKQDFQKQIDELKNHYNQLLATILDWEQAIKNSKSFNKSLDGIENIIDFFERHQLDFELNEDIIFIIMCNFLTHFNIKNKHIPVAINVGLVASELSISKYRAKRLVHRLQQHVCKFGCDFILDIAKDLPLECNYMELLPLLYKIADEGRAVLPCYIVSEIIFNHAIQEKIPTLLIANRFDGSSEQPYDVVYFLLQGNDNYEFSLIPCKPPLSQYCMVVSGEVYDNAMESNESSNDYIYRVISENPLKLILANTAIHPQYSGKLLQQYRDNPFHAIHSDGNKPVSSQQEIKLAGMQQFAQTIGCSKQNPTTFFLKHIYANTINNEINKLESNYTGCAYSIAGEILPTSYTTGHIYEKEGAFSFKST